MPGDFGKFYITDIDLAGKDSPVEYIEYLRGTSTIGT